MGVGLIGWVCVVGGRREAYVGWSVMTIERTGSSRQPCFLSVHRRKLNNSTTRRCITGSFRVFFPVKKRKRKRKNAFCSHVCEFVYVRQTLEVERACAGAKYERSHEAWRCALQRFRYMQYVFRRHFRQ